MIVPFGFEEAYKIVKKISGKRKAIKILKECFNRLAKCVLPEGEIIRLEDAYIIWVYACIIDDIADNHDYSQSCIHKGKSYARKYIKARENIREELNKIINTFEFVNIIGALIRYLPYITGMTQYIESNMGGFSFKVESELTNQINQENSLNENDVKQTLFDLVNNLRNLFNCKRSI